MNKTTSPKIISAAINLDEIDKKHHLTDTNLSEDEKQSLIQSILELPKTYNNSIDFILKDRRVVFLWKKPKISNEAEEYHRQAIAFAKKDDIENAIKNWEEAARIDPYHPEYFFNLGVASFEQKNYQEAIDYLSRTLAICPIFYKANLILGISYLKLRKFENAKNHIEKSLKFDKNNLLSYLNLGAIYSVLRDYQAGSQMFEKAIELAPTEPRPYMGLAKIHSAMGKTKEANEYYKKVIEFDKKGNLANSAKRALISVQQRDEPAIDVKYENPEDYYSQGYRLFLQGNFQTASQMYRQYLSLKPEDDYVWCALGESQLRNGEVINSVESFKKAAKLSPKKGLYFKELAVAFYYLEEYEKVIAAVTKAKDLGKTDSVTYSIWGKALLELGNVNEAIIILDHALKANKNNLLAKYFLAESLIKNNEPENAIGFLDEIINSKIETALKEKAVKMREKYINSI